MGEKEIEEDEGGTVPLGGGVPGTTGVPPTSGGGGLVDPVPTGGGGAPRTATRPGPEAPRTQEREDPCKEAREQAQALALQLEGLHTENRAHMQRALRAFFGERSSRTHGGYAHWFQQAQITEAVVDAQNATGKTLVDVALFALGGWGGIAKLAGATGKAAKLEKLFGTGIVGSESVLDAYGKVALKITEKAADEFVGGKAGKLGTTLYKTIDKVETKPEKWFQPGLGMVESIVRKSIIDALGDWMKSGAMAGDLGRAKEAYADFFAAATAANVAATAAAQVHEALRRANETLRAKGCPEVPIPDHMFHTFELTQFGQGNFTGQRGPRLRSVTIESGTTMDHDLFANVADPSGLPF